VKTSLTLSINSPKLWSPESPNLYHADVALKSGGKTLDQLPVTFGVRTLKFTPRDGFYLNGKRTVIKGVCNHHDLGPLGTAANKRALERQLALTPHSAPYRVALLTNFEEANPSAANALLKTLEEPPPRVILLLTAASAEALLPTVVSRCEVLRLRPMPIGELSAGLQTAYGVPSDEADFLAHLAGGRPGFALRLHQHPDLLASRTETIGAMLALLSANRIQRFAFAEQAAKSRDDLYAMLTVWLSVWRDVLMLTNGAAVEPTHIDYRPTLEALAASLTAPQALYVVQTLTQALDDLKHFVNARLVAENVVLALPSVPQIPHPSSPPQNP